MRAKKAVAKKPEIETPQRMFPNSRANRIASLEIGDSVSESKRVDTDTVGKDDVLAITANLKSTMSRAAADATKRSGHEFITEIGGFRTRSGHVIVTAVVTRLG